MMDIAYGLEAIHSVEGGPFIHADIQPRQFLADHDLNVRINDFNRGKFMQYSEVSHGQFAACKYCGARSKGRWRAPEEYSRQLLAPSLDTYSVGMVFWSMFAGERPMMELTRDQVYKRVVEEGYRPAFAECTPARVRQLVVQM